MIKKRGQSYQADFMHAGKRYRRQFDEKYQAESWEYDTKARLLRGEEVLDTQGTPQNGRTLKELYRETLQSCWKGSKSEDTLSHNGEDVARVLGESTPVRNIDGAAVNCLTQKLTERGLSNATINRKLAALSRMLKHAKQIGWIDHAPEIPRKKESQGRIRWLSDREEEAVLNYFQLIGDFEMYDMVIFLIDTGMRIGEAMRLEWRDVEWETRAMRLWENKTDHPRSVPMTRRVLEILKRRAETSPTHKVFNDRYDSYHYRWNRMREQLGYSDDGQFVLHMLRHTCASRLVMRGVSLPAIQKYLGHRSISTTMRYAHLAPYFLQEAAAALDETA